jgi:hypothetical protein
VAPVVTGSSSANVTSAARNTVGATKLRLFVITQNSARPTISDSLGNTWTPLGTVAQVSVNFDGWLHCFEATGTIIVGATHTFTCTGTVASTIAMIALRPTHGGTLTLGSWVVNNVAGTSQVSNSVTPPQDHALLVSFGAHDGTGNPTTYNWGSSFVEIASEKNAASFWTGSIATRVVRTTAVYTSSYTSSGSPSNGSTALFAVTEA